MPVTNRPLLLVAVFFFGATAFVLHRFVLPGIATDPSYLQNNLAPELLGLCLEGFVFVGLFELLSSWRDHRAKENLRGVLNDTLRRLRQELNEAAIASVQSHMWSLKMDVSNVHHAEKSKAGLRTLEPFWEQLNKDDMKVGLQAFYKLLSFLESDEGEPFRSVVNTWAMTGFDPAKQSRLEAFYPMAAFDSPSTLSKWSELLNLFRACAWKPRAFPAAEFRSLGRFLEATEF